MLVPHSIARGRSYRHLQGQLVSTIVRFQSVQDFRQLLGVKFDCKGMISSQEMQDKLGVARSSSNKFQFCKVKDFRTIHNSSDNLMNLSSLRRRVGACKSGT